MAATGNNFIDFVSELIYGDMGVAELGTPAPPSGQNHIHWTRDNIPNSVATAVTGDAFLVHHLDYLLDRYQQWRSKYFLPPVRPWDGQSAMDVEQSTTVPSAGPLPADTDTLGTSIRDYYNTTYRLSLTEEMDDEVKAPYSYRYWAFMKWASDLRRRVLGQPVFHVHAIFDRDGTVLSEKDFADIYHQVHHVWHPDGAIGSGWTQPTPFFASSVGQHQGKKEISRTQVGAEFFTFHRDHLDVFDRWLARTGQDPVQSINTCAHDTDPNDPVPAGVDADVSGYPHIEDWSATPPDVMFNDVHTTYWESDLDEFSNLGEMGQRFAIDFNQFSTINIPGVSDTGYHGTGHVLNSDLLPAVDNNFTPRFFAWHGFNNDVWIKREARFDSFKLLKSDGTDLDEPALIIVRDLVASVDTVEPATAIGSINLSTGEGTIDVEINVRPDPFGRTLELLLKYEVLRESGGFDPVITLSRTLTIIPSGAPAPDERVQGTTFTESFAADATVVDSAGDSPYVSDNAAFSPTPVGFKNSRILVRGHLTCATRPDGSIQPTSGSISTAGTSVTGAGTSFTTELRQGDLIRANGQVRQIVEIAGNTALTLLEPFDPDLGAGTTYEWLDGFDHRSTVELPLIQEKDAPDITTFLDRSTFSIEQVAAAGTTAFDDSFYVVLQDRTSRPFTITWPADVEPALHGLLAPPVYAAGLFDDLAHAPIVELRDETTDALIPDVVVDVTAVEPEDPTAHPTIPQRVTCRCRVTFTGHGAFAGLVNPGDLMDVKLVVTATDRANNQVIDNSLRVRLQINPNPFMLDGPTSWLSIDTRVFQIEEGQARFGVAAGWTDPNDFVQDVITNFRSGGGTAGGETLDGLPTEQASSRLEYSTSLSGTNIYNFALATVRLQSDTGLTDVRATFRLFRWGTANVEFNDTLAYRSAPSRIGLLGQTSTAEVASIPFFAEPRLAPAADMATQTDPTNLFDFGSTGGAEAQSYFGAYLDINQSTLQFPQAFSGDGPFGGVLHSIRDLLEDHHQCMVVEVVNAGDPTSPGATPGTSDNLAQRNLLIVQTANPGSPLTRTVQHAFNIDLTRSLARPCHDRVRPLDPIHFDHGNHDVDDDHDHDPRIEPHVDHDDDDGGDRPGERPDDDDQPGGDLNLQNATPMIDVVAPHARTSGGGHHELAHELAHLEEGWLAQAPNVLRERIDRLRAKFETEMRWSFDAEQWKGSDGVDELIFFWNNLPRESEVELYLPGANVEQIINFRNLRHAPGTVKIIDSQTLRLLPGGPTYIPIPPFWGDNLAGLVTVNLPEGIKNGQRFRVDVVQARADEARTLGGFQLNVQVEKAFEIWEAERRTLELFHQRMSIKAPTDRWLPIVERQVGFTRARGEALVELANEERPGEEPVEWIDPTEVQKGTKVRVVLERIRITDDREPFFKGDTGEFRFSATAWTPDNGEIVRDRALPRDGFFRLSDTPPDNEIPLEAVLFDDWVEDRLGVGIAGVELDTFDPDDRLVPYKRLFCGDPTSWFGSYGPAGDPVDPEELPGWQVWLRIEPGS